MELGGGDQEIDEAPLYFYKEVGLEMFLAVFFAHVVMRGVRTRVGGDCCERLKMLLGC